LFSLRPSLSYLIRTPSLHCLISSDLCGGRCRHEARGQVPQELLDCPYCGRETNRDETRWQVASAYTVFCPQRRPLNRTELSRSAAATPNPASFCSAWTSGRGGRPTRSRAIPTTATAGWGGKVSPPQLLHRGKRSGEGEGGGEGCLAGAGHTTSALRPPLCW
jgi:hypothetical protein